MHKCKLQVMTHAKNRSLRETMYRANITRASTGDIDNSPIIEKVRCLACVSL